MQFAESVPLLSPPQTTWTIGDAEAEPPSRVTVTSTYSVRAALLGVVADPPGLMVTLHICSGPPSGSTDPITVISSALFVLWNSNAGKLFWVTTWSPVG